MKEKLEKKLKAVREQKEKTVANLNSLIGAEQILLQLIKELSEDENDNS